MRNQIPRTKQQLNKNAYINNTNQKTKKKRIYLSKNLTSNLTLTKCQVPQQISLFVDTLNHCHSYTILLLAKPTSPTEPLTTTHTTTCLIYILTKLYLK